MNDMARFRDGGGVGRAAAIALVAGIVLDAYALAHSSFQVGDLPMTWMVFHFWVRLATVVTFMIWVDRATGASVSRGELD